MSDAVFKTEKKKKRKKKGAQCKKNLNDLLKGTFAPFNLDNKTRQTTTMKRKRKRKKNERKKEKKVGEGVEVVPGSS